MAKFDYIDLIGKPFEWGGRGPMAYDCWGLVRECLLRQGLKPPEYPSSAIWQANAMTMAKAMQAWKPLDWPTPGCAIALRMDQSGPTHCGIVVEEDKFLHITEKTCAVVERLTHPIWMRRIRGFYEWANGN